MAEWFFEPGHTGAEFRVRHMMVTWIRGHFKDVHGTLEFDPRHPANSSVEVTLDADKIWSGESDRDDHLRGADFLDVESHPTITFKSEKVDQIGEHDYRFTGELTIRGITKETALDVRFLGQWETPWWEDGADKGPKVRAGFVAKTRINRFDFGVSWNATLEKGGLVVGKDVFITIDAEAILVG